MNAKKWLSDNKTIVIIAAIILAIVAVGGLLGYAIYKTIKNSKK